MRINLSRLFESPLIYLRRRVKETYDIGVKMKERLCAICFDCTLLAVVSQSRESVNFVPRLRTHTLGILEFFFQDPEPIVGSIPSPSSTVKATYGELPFLRSVRCHKFDETCPRIRNRSNSYLQSLRKCDLLDHPKSTPITVS